NQPQDLGPYPWDRVVRVTTACEDSQGGLLVGTFGAGIFRFDPQGHATSISTNTRLSRNYILSLLEDREGTLWVGTDGGGLNRVKRPIFEVLEPTQGRVVQSVCDDGGSGLWIGYNDGGVDHWQESTVQRFGPSQGLVNLPVKSVFVDQKQRVWAGLSL